MAPNEDAWVYLNGKAYPPSELCSYLLQNLKETANDYLEKDVTKAVITVPAYFNDAQRRAIVNAGRLAGFDVLKIISEPYAAALSYGVNRKEDGHVAVVHFGGGTLMVYILEMSHGVIEINAASGDALGGENFDNILLGYLVTEFEKTESINLSTNKLALGRLREAAEKAKIELSTTMEAEIHLPSITADASGDKHLHITLSRSKLESLFSDFIENIKKNCQICLKQADVAAKDIAEVLLVGSMTKVPKVQEVVTKIFGKSPSQGVNPGEAVALGAAIEGGIISKDLKVDVDWGLRGAVTDITTQGFVCTCWAIGQIVDCAGPDGVEGAPQERAYNYFMTDGVCLDAEYPYTGARQDYVGMKSSRAFIDSFGRVGYGNKDLIAAVKEQPLTAGLSGSFVQSPVYQSYKGGPYFGDNYDFTTDALPHLVCIIGSEVIERQKFLKIKESRGKDWGDEGILHLAMSRDFYFGLGDVNMSVCYPIIHGDKAVYLSDTQISKLKEAFIRFDEDGDDLIETNVLGRVMTYLGKTLPEAEL
ncbi:hypothetical protein C5167_037299 [Papaver somniferum]|uniref:EF-hand domain-containing protein n=1 Tax=Papaver somniferum TaxID=3469 RepID=A0A4Y7IAB2_PAPSO|nr:hypothetical protein C5167_037299 [Papaver somniferum]